MKKVIRLTEGDLVNLVKRVINEQNENETKIIKNLLNKLFNKTVQFYTDVTQKIKGPMLTITSVEYTGESNIFDGTNSHIIVIRFKDNQSRNPIFTAPEYNFIFDCSENKLVYHDGPSELKNIKLYNKQLSEYIYNNYCKLLSPDNPTKKPDFSSTQKPTNPPQNFV